jgi:hypothetical protein
LCCDSGYSFIIICVYTQQDATYRNKISTEMLNSFCLRTKWKYFRLFVQGHSCNVYRIYGMMLILLVGLCTLSTWTGNRCFGGTCCLSLQDREACQCSWVHQIYWVKEGGWCLVQVNRESGQKHFPPFPTPQPMIIPTFLSSHSHHNLPWTAFFPMPSWSTSHPTIWCHVIWANDSSDK